MHETNTSTIEYTKDIEQQQETSLEYAQSFVDDITSSELFIQSAYEKGIPLDETSNDDYIELLADTTDAYVEQFADELEAEDAAAIKVLGRTPHALRQKQLLDATHSGSPVSRQEISNAKDALIHYNTLISDLLASAPDQPLETLSQAITTAGVEKIEISSDEAYRYSMETLRGIRMENAFESIVDSLGVVAIRHGDIKEERKGIDFVLTGADGTELKIDIKSSLDQVAGKNGGYSNTAYAYHRGVFTLFPYLLDSHFEHNSSTLAPGVAEQVGPQLLGDLFQMSQQSIDNNHR